MAEHLSKFRCQVRLYKDTSKFETLTVEAVNQEDAVNRLQKEGFLVVSIDNLDGIEEEEKQKTQVFESKKKVDESRKSKPRTKGLSLQLFPSVSATELISFAIQLSTLLEAGIPLVRALQIIRKGVKNAYFGSILDNAVEKVSQGFSFSYTISQHPKVFTNVWVNLVEVGEASGKLVSGLREVAHYQEATERIKSKVISAFFYPTVLLIFAVAAVTFLMMKIIPKFEEIFASFHVKLPLITKWVIFISTIVRVYFPFVIAGIFLIVTAISFFYRTKKGRYFFDFVRLKMPIMGMLLLEVSIIRFSRSLCTLIRSGIPLLRGIEIGTKLAENAVVEEKLEEVRKKVQGGHALGSELSAKGLFPVFMTQLVSVGEETGELDRFLELISNYYEDRVDTFLARLSTLIEPLLLIVMGALIGTLVVAMFLPIIEISTGGS